MKSKRSRTISLILALVMVLGLFPSLGPSADAELLEFDPFSVTYGIPTSGLVDAPAGVPVLTETVPQHAHHFVYSAEGNTIVAHCDATDCPLENGEARLVLKTDDAAKADHPYTGASVQNTIPLSENAVLGPVVYYSLNESELVETGAQPESFLTEENRLEIAPKRVGTYLASVTLTVDGTDYTVWNVFEIYLPKAAITVRPEPVEGLVYDGQPHALVTPGEAGGNAVLYAVLANDETEPTEGFDDTFPMAADAGLYVVWFRAAGDADHEDGDTDHVVVRIQKAAQAAPSAPEAEEIMAESIILKASEGYEYSMDGETWQNDNTFAGLTADTEYRFFQRITGDYNLAPSPAGEAAVFRTLEADPVVEAEAEPVKLWFVCDPPETVLSVRSSAEGSSPVSPEEDGSYLLLPGSWICSAAAEGYHPIENSEFTVSAENGETQYMTLELQKLPPLVSPAFEETAYVSGMAVRVSAPEGVFPEGSTLSVTPVPVQEQQFVDAAVGSERGGSKTVMVSYTFDIKVIGPDGNEVQPADAQKVKVSFTANAVAEQNLSTDVYHVSGEGASLSAERLDTVEDGATVTAEASGFSYYTVEFTYETLQYVLPGGENVALSEILNTVGLSGTVTGVQCSRPDLFSADTRSGEWVVYSHQPFTSTEWMKVVINGLEYTIVVTDAPNLVNLLGNSSQIHLISFECGEVSEIVLNRAANWPLDLELNYDGGIPEGNKWVAESTGPISAVLDSNRLKISCTGTGNASLKLKLKNGLITTAEKAVNVVIKNEPVPSLNVNPDSVVINLAEKDSVKVKYNYHLPSWAGSIVSHFDFGGCNDFSIGFSDARQEIEIYLLSSSTSFLGDGKITCAVFQSGHTDPAVYQVIKVKVIDQKPQDSSQSSTDGTNKSSGSSAPGGGNSTGGSSPIAPGGNNTPAKTTKKTYTDKEKNAFEKWVVPQSYRINSKYEYETGICNVNAYATLLNRYVAKKYDDYSFSIGTEEALDAMHIKINERFYFNVKKLPKNREGASVFKFIIDGKEPDSEKTTNHDLHNIKSGIGYILKPKGEKDKGTSTTRFYKNPNTYPFKYTSNYTNGKTVQIKMKTVNAAENRSPEKLAELVKAHEKDGGIYIFAKGHAVVITRCEEKDGDYTFSILDPAKGAYPMTITKDQRKIMKTGSYKVDQISVIGYLY